ncbi:MAG TPA: addiction module protein [Verrucomicrobiae bacterium]|nr:addiction module protein [Verrucomicrobiae bacterium]
MKSNLLEDALKLSLPERIKLADEIYRSVDRETDNSISADILAEMELRDVAYEANPKSGCSIGELEKKLFKRK